jgi:hypothetical protein
MFTRLLPAAVVVVCSVACAAPDAVGKKYQGAIQSLTESQVAIQVGTESLTFMINKNTTITLNGKAAKIGDLKVNDMAEIAGVKADDEMTLRATAVAVTRKSI